MRSAGCIVNDIVDKNLDKKIQRTKNRPLACDLISINLALIYTAILCAIAFFILIQFNFVAHGFVAGGSESESERPLAVGGAETIDASVFNGFSYIALGHLHRPQSIGSPRIQYSGSLMKYSTSELDHTKSMTVAQIPLTGDVVIERVPIPPLRDLRRVEGVLDDVIARGPEGNPDDYVVVRLLDKGPVFDAMARVRTVYPNALHLERIQVELEGSVKLPSKDHREMGVPELFDAFYLEVMGEELDEEAREVLLEILNEDAREEVAA